MSDPLAWPVLIWLTRSILGATLLVAGATNLRDIRPFWDGALVFGLGDPRRVAQWAPRVPWAMAAIGGTLLAGWATRLAAALALALLLVFAFAAAVGVRRGRRFPCYFFGPGNHDDVGVVLLMRLAIMIAMAAMLAAAPVEVGAGVPGLSTSDTVALACTALLGMTVLIYAGAVESIARLWWEVRQASAARARQAIRVATPNGRETS